MTNRTGQRGSNECILMMHNFAKGPEGVVATRAKFTDSPYGITHDIVVSIFDQWKKVRNGEVAPVKLLDFLNISLLFRRNARSVRFGAAVVCFHALEQQLHGPVLLPLCPQNPLD